MLKRITCEEGPESVEIEVTTTIGNGDIENPEQRSDDDYVLKGRCTCDVSEVG